MTYKFRASEIEEMKQAIMIHCQKDGTSWRLGVVLFGLANCTGCSKRERAKAERKYALFESLTVNNVPNWI